MIILDHRVAEQLVAGIVDLLLVSGFVAILQFDFQIFADKQFALVDSFGTSWISRITNYLYGT